MWQGAKDCFTQLVAGAALQLDRRRARRGARHRRLGHRLARLRPCDAHREGRAADLRQGRRARRHRLRERQQRQGRRRARPDHRLRRAGQRRHGDPARRLPDPRPRPRPGHARPSTSTSPTRWCGASRIANILGAGLCYLFSGQFAKLATLRYTLILPSVLGIIYIGAFQGSRHWGDLYTLLFFGVLGWIDEAARNGRGRR